MERKKELNENTRIKDIYVYMCDCYNTDKHHTLGEIQVLDLCCIIVRYVIRGFIFKRPSIHSNF